jgi:hypothetical protein
MRYWRQSLGGQLAAPFFFNKGLINIGGDDAKFEKLGATASQIAVMSGKRPHQ